MARRRAGLTQRELAERLGLRQATIARWERGDRQVSVEDVEVVAAACGLHLEAHLVAKDHSWWSQIALQLELDPLDRLRRLTPPGSPGLANPRHGCRSHRGSQRIRCPRRRGRRRPPGWPLVLGGGGLEVCSDVDDGATCLCRPRSPSRSASVRLPGGARLQVVDVPPGTHGFEDLRRGRRPDHYARGWRARCQRGRPPADAPTRQGRSRRTATPSRIGRPRRHRGQESAAARTTARHPRSSTQRGGGVRQLPT